jgi:hypothetical protein
MPLFDSQRGVDAPWLFEARTLAGVRSIWNLERLARHRAAKLSYRLHPSRRCSDNAGDFMLLHKKSSDCLAGHSFTATLEMILEFVERERTALAGAAH